MSSQVHARPSVVMLLFLAFSFRCFLFVFVSFCGMLFFWFVLFFVGGLTKVFNNGFIDSVLKKALASGGGRRIEVKYDII